MVAELENVHSPVDGVINHDAELSNGQLAEALLKSRRQRDAIFEAHCDGLGEPAWDSLLLLYAEKAKGRHAVSVDELLAVTCAPAEIARPYIAWLASHHLAAREGGNVALTDRGQALMSAYLDRERGDR